MFHVRRSEPWLAFLSSIYSFTNPLTQATIHPPPSIHPSTPPSIHPSLSIHLFPHPSIHLHSSIHPPIIHLFIHTSSSITHPSINHPSSNYPSTYPFIHPLPIFNPPPPHSLRVEHLPGPIPDTREEVTSQSAWSCPGGDRCGRCRMEGAKAERLPSHPPGPGNAESGGLLPLPLAPPKSDAKTLLLLGGRLQAPGLDERWGISTQLLRAYWETAQPGDTQRADLLIFSLAWCPSRLPVPEPQDLQFPKHVHTQVPKGWC